MNILQFFSFKNILSHQTDQYLISYLFTGKVSKPVESVSVPGATTESVKEPVSVPGATTESVKEPVSVPGATTESALAGKHGNSVTGMYQSITCILVCM